MLLIGGCQHWQSPNPPADSSAQVGASPIDVPSSTVVESPTPAPTGDVTTPLLSTFSVELAGPNPYRGLGIERVDIGGRETRFKEQQLIVTFAEQTPKGDVIRDWGVSVVEWHSEQEALVELQRIDLQVSLPDLEREGKALGLSGHHRFYSESAASLFHLMVRINSGQRDGVIRAILNTVGGSS